MRIGCWNCRGFLSAVPYARELSHNLDVVALSEHWLHNNRLHMLDDINDQFHTLGRSSLLSSEENYGTKRGQGGVALIWRKCLNGVTPIKTLNHDRICAIRVQGVQGSITNIYSVYLPAVGSSQDYQSVLDELACAIEQTETGACNIIMGDFNADLGSLRGTRNSKPPSKNGKALNNFMLKYSYIATNAMDCTVGPVETFESQNGSSSIDYILLPSHMVECVVNSKVMDDEPLNTSDHRPVLATVSLDVRAQCSEGIKVERKLKWGKLSKEEMRDKYETRVRHNLEPVMEYLNDTPINGNKLDLAFDMAAESLRDASKVIPTSKYAPHLKPYWCDELRALKANKMRLLKVWKDNGRTSNPADPIKMELNHAKKLFAKRVRSLSKEYEQKEIAEISMSAEIDRNRFWKHLKRLRGGKDSKIFSIRDVNQKVVHEPKEVLEVWRQHFDKLSTPKVSPEFNEAKYQTVTGKVEEWFQLKDQGPFLDTPFSLKEIRDSVSKLHKNKAPGHDSITAEHVKYAGESIIIFLHKAINLCVRVEYIPRCFREGVQVPIYKGKNTCTLDPDNYRGITLLSTFSKIFEVLLWGRLEPWCNENRAVSETQGACRKGSSCIHTALTLQETIAKEREGNKKVLVAYVDVTKAFDSVWIDGLFYQMHEMGITGVVWRLLYKTYLDFKSCVKIGGEKSQWFKMSLGIHQGGFLSLNKYTFFINSLLVNLQNSGLCSTIYRIKSSPGGYADDVAACTTSALKMDSILRTIYKHGCDWRYTFNAKKSAVLVFNESGRERALGQEHRNFNLGGKKVKEKLYYDHVGIKACVDGDTHTRTQEKAIKARKVFNMITGVGIKKGGISIATCNIIFWCVIVPILTYGCEIWVLKEKDVQILDEFQRYTGRRIQRLPLRCPNATSFITLGWLRLSLYIKAKKLIFIRTITVIKYESPLKEILVCVLGSLDGVSKVDNPFDSPLLDSYNTSIDMGLGPQLVSMVTGTKIFSKEQWKKLVWERVWHVQTAECKCHTLSLKSLDLIKHEESLPKYSTWWQIADVKHNLIRQCEHVIKLICHASRLKSDDYRLKDANRTQRMCEMCDEYAIEDAEHVLMRCPALEVHRIPILSKIHTLCDNLSYRGTFEVLLGATLEGYDFESMLDVRVEICMYINRVYMITIKSRNVN